VKTARAFVFYLGICLAALAVFFLLLLSWPLPLLWRWRIALLWNKFFLFWLNLTCGLRMVIEGKEHLPPKPAVFVCKHQSALETVLLPYFLYPTVPVMKKELLWIPFLGWGLWLISVIPIKREAPHKALVVLKKHAERAIAKGFSILIFPEGTRVAPGETGTYHKGGIWLAKALNVPIVPIALNTGLFWPRQGFRKNPGLAKAVIYPALQPSEYHLRELNILIEHIIETGTRKLEKEALPVAASSNPI
jgi:1-acyl-sn-glycerol-3-phosphate acyltransferase